VRTDEALLEYGTKHRAASGVRREAVPARRWVYESLKTAILTQQVCPGERLTEHRIATLLRVSRTPVREALHRLAIEGLLVQRPRRGFAVPPVSTAERDDLLELWGTLQGYALRSICERVTPTLRLALESAVREAAEALAEGDRVAGAYWNRQFHHCLWGGPAEQSRLIDHIGRTEQLLLPYRLVGVPAAPAAHRAMLAHRGILLALELRDAELCEHLMRAHSGGLEALACLTGLQ
jgi:GntR family transcriptional regulator, rspAB operon transcriptional repressor